MFFFFDVPHRGEYRVVYLTPEYASLDTGFLAQVQNSVGKKKLDKRNGYSYIISMLIRVKD